MQTKMIAAAAIASSSMALTLEASTTVQAQASAYTRCHGVYAYQCIEEKVEIAFNKMTGEVQSQKEECLETANNLREDMLEGIQDLRESLMDEMSSQKADLISSLTSQLNEAKDAIENAAAAANQAICDEADARVDGTSALSLERIAVQNAIKKLYYEDNNSYSPYELKEKIAKKVHDFQDLLNEGCRSFECFVDSEIDQVEAIISERTTALTAAIASAHQQWNMTVSESATQLSDEIDDKLAEMDALIAVKTTAINDVINTLTEDFIIVFWDTISEIFDNVTRYERQGLIWKALYQKQQFLTAVKEIRDYLIQGLSDTRTGLSAELMAEKIGMTQWISSERNSFVESTNAMRANLAAFNSATRQELGDLVDAKNQYLEENHASDEGATLEQFVYELTDVSYNPNASGLGHGNGYQPYAKWVANELYDQIAIFGDESLATFDTITSGEINNLDSILGAEQYALHTFNVNIQAALDAATDDLITGLIGTREGMELTLSNNQDSQEANDEAQREIDQIALVTTKNNLWKDMSWIIRQTQQNGAEHGYSAGPVYAVVQHPGQPQSYAQTSQSAPNFYGPNLADSDGYNPFGYGEQGFGYGVAQYAFKDIQDKLDAMTAAQTAIKLKNEARISASRTDLEATHHQAYDDFEAALQEKWDIMTGVINLHQFARTQAIAEASARMAEAIDAARQRILGAKLIKNDALDAEEKQIRWAATSIYNYDVQHSINNAITQARAEANGYWTERTEYLLAELQRIQDSWDASVDYEIHTFDVNVDQETGKCEDSKIAQGDIFYAFKDAAVIRFEEWAQSEQDSCNEFVDEVDTAWQWILESYCLKHGTEGIVGAGYGCTFANGSGYGNAGYKKGVPIEQHDEILAYGQDIDIKNVQDVPGLINHAVDFTMEGVSEEADSQLVQVNQIQAEINTSIAEARQQIEHALNAQLEASMYSLDNTSAVLQQQLADRDVVAIQSVDEARIAKKEAVEALREQTLWDIKENVWRLGYTQGYAYGAHDGHDREIQVEIARKKDEFEAFVIATLQWMHERVNAEEEASDLAAEQRTQELQDEFDRHTAAMEDSLAAALSSFEYKLQSAKAEMMSETARATEALNAFIAERLAVWQEKYTYEEINAKWQEDSYYRYNLLRLLAAKQDAIDQAVNQAKSAFAAAMSAEKVESTAFRGTQRDLFAQFVSDTRQALADGIQDDDRLFTNALQVRDQAFDSQLADQQTQLEDAMEECRQEMKLRLKEIYNYNSYDWQASQSAETAQGVYSHEQHKAFLYKFAYYHKALLNQFDVLVGNFKTAASGHVIQIEEESLDQQEDLQILVLDQREMAEKQLTTLSKNLIEQYQDEQDNELKMLRDSRDAAEAAAYSNAEGFKKDIIYAMHVIRYAGGQQDQGFGTFGSSYYGKGNSLTGVDELDLIRAPALFKYAQTEASNDFTAYGGDDEHHTQLVTMLFDAKTGFDDMIQACKDDFSELVQAEKDESENRRQQVSIALSNAADAHLDQAAALAQSTEAQLASANDDRKNDFWGWAQNILEIFGSQITAQQDKINGWFDDKLEWVDKLYDSHYKEQLKTELETKAYHATQQLQDRIDEAQAVMDEASYSLEMNLSAHESELWDFHAYHQHGLNTFITNLKAHTSASATATNMFFMESALHEDAIKIANADALVITWAYWLKYIYSYEGYETSLYLNYDPFHDYGDGYSSDEYVGDYLQQSQGGHGGYQPSQGFGYGGDFGADYLFSDDSSGLAYGTQTGPDPEYFKSGFLDYFDQDEEEHAHEEMPEEVEEVPNAALNNDFIQSLLGSFMLNYSSNNQGSYGGLNFS